MRERLTPHERFGLMVIDEPQDRLLVAPLCTSHAARILPCDLRTYHTDGRAMGRAQVKAREFYKYDFICIFSDCGILAEALGSEFDFPQYDLPALRKPLLTEPGPLPELDLGQGRLRVYRDAVDLCYRALGDIVPVLAFVPAPFTSACYLLAAEQLLARTITDAPAVSRMLEEIADRTILLLEDLIDHGALPMLVDPLASSSVISPRTYQGFALPAQRKLIDFLHRFDLDVILHICGETEPILELIPQTGADLVSIDRTRLDQASQRIGSQVRLIGNFDTSTLLFGEPDTIEAQTALMVAQARDNPKDYVISTGCEVPIETPVENLKTFIRVAREVA